MSPPPSRPSATGPAPHERAPRASRGSPAPGLRLRIVTSARNPALRLVAALQTKKVRRERRLLVAEGEDLVDAALERGVSPVALLVDADRVPDDDPRLAATEGLAERYRVPG